MTQHPQKLKLIGLHVPLPVPTFICPATLLSLLLFLVEYYCYYYINDGKPLSLDHEDVAYMCHKRKLD